MKHIILALILAFCAPFLQMRVPKNTA